ncbi:ribose-phosphate diphosphokinase [Ramlibacter tataouinensis]|uniref:ribose-phosphate diphosphokinase n=1 Tax=Ramlibacter tataouinensis TaxID=94132 RepID=UPI0022F39BC9|nr:ribose-phosphate diphosphokinase [Ramlibacter tataouinensis]WBY01321.1 ribose-phosphate diphosphokinase [Ramlibacter tataouinensis]
MNTVILPAPGAEAAAELFASHLRAGSGRDVRVGRVEFRRFPDGEAYVRLLDSVHDAHVWVIATLREPDPQALTLLFLADTARELGAASVGLAAPYLPYMRQDIRFRDGEAVTSRTFARVVSQAFDRLVTVDPHLHRYPSLDAVYRIPAAVAPSAPAIARWISQRLPRPVVIGPDGESEQWARDVAARVGCPVLVLSKQRLGDRAVEISLPQAEGLADRQPVLIDDIISSARTMATAVRNVRAAFGQAPLCIGVHAVLAPDALDVLREAGAGEVVTCNTLTMAPGSIDVLGELAQAAAALAALRPATPPRS